MRRTTQSTVGLFFVPLRWHLLAAASLAVCLRFNAPAQPLDLDVQLDQSQGQIRFTWTAAPGKRYSLQSTPDLSPPAWSNLDSPITISGTTATAMDIIQSSARERYYRVVELTGSGGGGGGGSLEGGSKSPSGAQSSVIAPTALALPSALIETNGLARVRYLEFVGSAGWLEERTGPPVIQMDELTNINHPVLEDVLKLNHFLIHHPAGFGSSLSISISLPSGLRFHPQFQKPTLDAWGTYPEVSPTHFAFRFPMDTSANAIGFETFEVTSLTSSNLSLRLLTDRILIPPNNQMRSSPANLKVLRFTLDPPIRVENVGQIDGRIPTIRLTINGALFECGLGFTSDPDPEDRQQFVRQIDEAGGTINLLSGEHAFSVPLFEGQGLGLNLEGVLFYSSLKASWDRAVLNRAQYKEYTHIPLGPGWAYPYGIRILTSKRLRWDQGPPKNEPDAISVVTADGALSLFSFIKLPNTTVSHDGVTYDEFYRGRLAHSAVSWAQFHEPIIVKDASGGYLLFERSPSTNGFTRLKFDAQGRLLRVDPHGGAPPLTLSYPANQQVVTDSSGRSATFEFGPREELVRILDPAGGIWIFTYAAGGALVKVHEQATGYGWEFAVDNEHYLLTERKLPHGFIIQSDFHTQPADTNRFFWGALKSTRWKDSPDASTRQVTYQRQANPNSSTPDRVSINMPSQRNVLHYDLSNIQLAMSIANTTRGDVVISDEVEGSPGTLQFRNRESSGPNIFGGLFYENTNPSGDVRRTHFRGPHFISLQREDGAVFERAFALPPSQPVTYHAVTRETHWRSKVIYQYRHANPGTALEKLREIYPPGQDPQDPAAKKTVYNYDAANRLESILDPDGHLTQYVYEPPPNAGLVRTEIRCVGEPPPFTTTERNPYRWNRTYDGLGRLTSLTDPEKNTTLYLYDTAGRMVQMLGPTNITGSLEIPRTTFEYDGDLVSKITTQVSSNQELKFLYSYDDRGRLIEEQEPGPQSGAAPLLWKYEYDAEGDRIRTISPSGGITADTFDNRRRLIRSVGPEGETVEFDYDPLDSVREMRRVSGSEVRRWTVLSRDKLGRIAELELPAVLQGGVTGRPKIALTYDEHDNLTRERYSFAGSSLTTDRQFGSFDEMVREITDMGGNQEHVEAFVSDHLGRVIQRQGAIARTNISPGLAFIQRQPNRTAPTIATYRYNCFNAVDRITDINSDERLKLGFDLRGMVSQVQLPDPSVPQGTRAAADTLVHSYNHDPAGQIAAISDVFNHQSRFQRDLLGRETAIHDPAGTSWETDYTPHGEISKTSIGPASAASVTQTLYDERGLPRASNAPGNDGPGTALQIDRSGRLLKTTDPDGNSVQLLYNGFGEIIREIKASGARIDYTRDSHGRITLTATFLPSGQLESRVTTEYDRFGRVFALDDAHRRIEQDYDNLGRVTEKRTTIKARNFTERLTYRWGQYGNLVSMEDHEGYRTEYTWDNEDNLQKIRLVPPAGEVQEVEFNHDRVGKLTSYNFRSGSTAVLAATLARDKKAQITKLNFTGLASGLPNAEYSYDNRDQRLQALYHHKDLKVNYTYDSRGFLTAETWSQLSNGTNIYQDQIAYDPAGNRTRRQQDGAITSYTYGPTFKLATEQRESLARIQPALIQVTADSIFSAGFEPAWANDLKSPDSIQPQTGWRSATNSAEHWIRFTLDALRPISAIDISFPTARGAIQDFRIEIWDESSKTFQPARPSQLIRGILRPPDSLSTSNHTVRALFSVPQLASSWRIRIPPGGAGKNPQTGAPHPDVMINEVAFFQRITELIQREFDRDGRLVKDGAFIYGYDVEGRLTRLVGPGVDKTWTITPEGLRGSETDHLTGRTVYFGHSGANVYAEYDEQGRSRLKHLSGLGVDTQLGFYERDSAGITHFRWCVREGPGSIVQVLDEQGKLLDDRLLNAWGEDLITPTQLSANPYGFAGRRHEPGANLYYHRARIYDPKTGRFTSPDPRGHFSGPNLYAYAANNPILYRDPEGEFLQVLIGAAIGFGVDLGLQLYQNGGDFSQVDVGQLAVATGVGAATGGLASFARSTALGVARAATVSRATQATVGAARTVQVTQTTQRLATAARATLGLQAVVGAFQGKDALAHGLEEGDPVYIAMGVAAIWGLRHAYAGSSPRSAPPRAGQRTITRTAPRNTTPTAPRAVHFTDLQGQTGIQTSRYLNGPNSVWAFAARSVPQSRLAIVAKSLLRPSRTTHQVTINASGLTPPLVRSPFSAFQRLSGVLRTPGPGTYHIGTGRFIPGMLYDPDLGRLRPMTRGELLRGGRVHDIVLEAIGWGGLAAAGMTVYTALKDDN